MEKENEIRENKAKSMMANKVSIAKQWSMANKGNSRVLFCMNRNMVALLLYTVIAYQ